MIATPTSPKTASHMLAMPSAASTKISSLMPSAKIMFCQTIDMVLRATRIAREMLDGLSSISTTSAARSRRPSPWRPWQCHIGARKHRRVVDAVTDKGELALVTFGREQRLNALDLVARQELRVELVETELLGHRRCNLLAVAREHDGSVDTGGMQVANRLLRIGLNGVCNHDVAGVHAVNEHVEDRADNLAVRCFNAGRGEHLGVANDDVLASMVAVTPWPASLAESLTRLGSTSPW